MTKPNNIIRRVVTLLLLSLACAGVARGQQTYKAQSAFAIAARARL